MKELNYLTDITNLEQRMVTENLSRFDIPVGNHFTLGSNLTFGQMLIHVYDKCVNLYEAAGNFSNYLSVGDMIRMIELKKQIEDIASFPSLDEQGKLIYANFINMIAEMYPDRDGFDCQEAMRYMSTFTLLLSKYGEVALPLGDKNGLYILDEYRMIGVNFKDEYIKTVKESGLLNYGTNVSSKYLRRNDMKQNSVLLSEAEVEALPDVVYPDTPDTSIYYDTYSNVFLKTEFLKDFYNLPTKEKRNLMSSAVARDCKKEIMMQANYRK